MARIVPDPATMIFKLPTFWLGVVPDFRPGIGISTSYMARPRLPFTLARQVTPIKFNPRLQKFPASGRSTDLKSAVADPPAHAFSDARSYELIARVFDGQSEGLTRDDIHDHIALTWLTNTALSGARLYLEYLGKGYFNAKGARNQSASVGVQLTSPVFGWSSLSNLFRNSLTPRLRRAA